MGTDQGNSLNWMYVWDAGGPPVADAEGRFSNVQGNPNSAIPVFVVAAPSTDTPPYPDNQGAICNADTGVGAIPIKYAAQPAATGPYPNNPQNAAGAIAVYLVTAVQPENGPYPNSQSASGGATPVYVVT